MPMRIAKAGGGFDGASAHEWNGSAWVKLKEGWEWNGSAWVKLFASIPPLFTATWYPDSVTEFYIPTWANYFRVALWGGGGSGQGGNGANGQNGNGGSGSLVSTFESNLDTYYATYSDKLRLAIGLGGASVAKEKVGLVGGTSTLYRFTKANVQQTNITRVGGTRGSGYNDTRQGGAAADHIGPDGVTYYGGGASGDGNVGKAPGGGGSGGTGGIFGNGGPSFAGGKGGAWVFYWNQAQQDIM